MSMWVRMAILGAVLLLAPGAWAQAPIVYPSKGQSPKQQQLDEAECNIWAKQQTGVDPAALAAAPPQAPPTYGRAYGLGGAARGAAGGAAIGALAGNAGEGAAIGALAGGMLGRRRARFAQEEGMERAQSQRQGQLQTYYRAVSACLVGRGYTVQ